MTTTMLRELVRDPLITGLCQVIVNRVWCAEPLEAVWEGGCVHEHVMTDIGICAEHRELAERPFVCVRCEPDHKCMAQLREVAA